MEGWLNPTTLVALGAMLGVGAVLKSLVDWLLKRRDTRDAGRGEYDRARLEDGAALRGEVWVQFRAEQERNAKLSQQLGQEIQEKAQALARATNAQEQIASLAGSLAAALREKDEAQTRLSRRNDEYDLLRATHSDVLEKLDVAERHARSVEAELTHAQGRLAAVEHRRRASDSKE